MHLPNNHQSQFAGFAHKAGKINKIKNLDKTSSGKAKSTLHNWTEWPGKYMLASICLHWNATSYVWTWNVYMFTSFALWDHSLLREWCLTGSGITLDSLRRFLVELWNTSTGTGDSPVRWLLNPLVHKKRHWKVGTDSEKLHRLCWISKAWDTWDFCST